MSDIPECAVVIPTRDCLAYLPAALASVDMQGLDNIEVIVVDDGSRDGADAWLARRSARDSRLRIVTLDGVGPSAARNAAIARARAPLIAFLDADDIWWPGKLKRQIDHHRRHPDIGLSFTDYIHFTPDGRLHGTCFEYWRPPFASYVDTEFLTVEQAELALLETNAVGTSTVVATARELQIANGFSQIASSAEDWDLWLRIAARAPVACSSSVTAAYLMRPTSETANRRARILAMESIIGGFATRDDLRAQRAARRATSRICVARAELARLEHRRHDAFREHVTAFSLRPDRRVARAALADFLALSLGRLGDTP